MILLYLLTHHLFVHKDFKELTKVQEGLKFTIAFFSDLIIEVVLLA